MNRHPFLEIVVPTFNRAAILSSTLRELVSAIASQVDEIGLRVIDNCSTDNTPLVVNPYVLKGQLIYDKNNSNIGLVKNIAKSISSSRAQWVWVFGDDDHILSYSLPHVIDSLRQLNNDYVFARALSAKVSDSGFITHIESACPPSSNRIIRHDPGVEIAANGSIHSLAFISQLLINPFHWDQDYFLSLYNETDLYTFVLTLLRQSIHKKAADINIHIVAATDRGDRGYYTPNMCVARLTEYTSYEYLVHNALGKKKARKILSKGRINLLKCRIASCFKLVKNNRSYLISGIPPVSYMLFYRSPYLRDVIVVRIIAIISKLPWASLAMGKIYDFLLERN